MNYNKLFETFWTPEKCGKYGNRDLVEKHINILRSQVGNETVLKAKPEDFIEVINSNIFQCKDGLSLSWNNILSTAKLSEYLNIEYVNKCNKLSLGQPEIGKGEFLFVSIFKNLNFAKESGDIIDIKNNYKIEFKGLKSTISGYTNKSVSMNSSIMASVYAALNTSSHNVELFNKKEADEIDRLLRIYPKQIYEVLKRLHNVRYEDTTLFNEFSKCYAYHNDIFHIIGAMQLYNYLKNKNFLIMVNDMGIKCFSKPTTAEEAYILVKDKLKLSSWYTKETGMTIGI